ncbi:uncharacterized protein C8A04DRAFT_33252 [Dichotomopilus funicola]|uniref:Uncharacterized protein n=1 Tax=Dichotomopilus funicola TaxID=1934379 RepID=A0AAN6ZIY1_9PEZI|nr:hypothetical protein C8A04DRAFT_33252 [Dichotomopilus funicola]
MGSPTGPWNIPEATYNEVLDSPSAVGRYTLEAPDISVRYPSPDQFANWTLAVSVASDFPLPWSNTNEAEQDTTSNRTFTATRVRLTPPAGIDVDSSWEVCVLNWDVNLETYPTQLRIDDGTCTSFLSEQCIRDVEQSVLVGRCSCPNLREIESCGDGQADLMDSIGPGCFAKPFNKTTIEEWPAQGYNVREFGGVPHPHSQGTFNNTAYDEVGSLAWPVLLRWGPSLTVNVATSSSGGGSRTKLTCARANHAVGGNSVPGVPGGDSGAMSVMGSSGFVLAVAVVVGWVVGWS